MLRNLQDISLEGFLLTPVQKICKYPLQLFVSEIRVYVREREKDGDGGGEGMEQGLGGGGGGEILRARKEEEGRKGLQ